MTDGMDPRQYRDMDDDWVYVCLDCGQVKGEHSGWSRSCELHCGKFRIESLVRGPHGLVVDVLDNVGMGFRRV